MISCLSRTRLQSNNHCLSFYVFEVGEPGRDKLVRWTAICSTATTTTTHMATAVYTVLLQGMCLMMALALTTS